MQFNGLRMATGKTFTAAVDHLRDVLNLGAESGWISTETEARAAYAVDGITPQCVLYPRSKEETAEMLARAAECELAVIPCRNATKLHIGNPPRRYDAALCVKQMNQVWQCEPDDLTLSVEPGIKFGDLQHYLSRFGLWIPLDPAGGAKASLGGIVAANSAGPLRLHYGAPRDIVLGMKIATAGGKLVKTGGRVVKNVAGYDVAKLLTGSFGTLGVIVELSLKLFPLPSRRETRMLTVPSLDAAAALRRAVLDSPLSPLRMVLLAGAGGWIRDDPAGNGAKALEIWIEFGGSERILRRCADDFEQLARAVGGVAILAEPDLAEQCWERISDFDLTARKNAAAAVLLKASLPIAAAEKFIERAERESEKARIAARFVAHGGVGIVYVAGDRLSSDGDSIGWITALRAAALDLAGTLVVERCSREIKERIEVWGAPGDDFEMMRRLKAAWDPKGSLSPGRFVGGL